MKSGIIIVHLAIQMSKGLNGFSLLAWKFLNVYYVTYYCKHYFSGYKCIFLFSLTALDYVCTFKRLYKENCYLQQVLRLCPPL